MAAPETHPLEHIVTIRRLLDHYEQGFAFIKELVQNADDALKDSTQPGRLHLQWHYPKPDSGFENPLLRGPALIAKGKPSTVKLRLKELVEKGYVLPKGQGRGAHYPGIKKTTN